MTTKTRCVAIIVSAGEIQSRAYMAGGRHLSDAELNEFCIHLPDTEHFAEMLDESSELLRDLIKMNDEMNDNF